MLRYLLLGPLAVERDGVPLELGTPKQRAVLAVLVQGAGQTVSVDRLVDAVWGEQHPGNVQSSVHANISRLRRLLRDDPSAPPPIVRRPGGYLLDVTRAEIDVDQFLTYERTAAAAVDAREWAAAADAAVAALALWRGGYLADLGDEEWVRTAGASLAERRAGVEQTLVVGLLGTGDIAGALARSTAMAAEQPLVERAAWLHMVALHRAGRTAEALDTYRGVAGRLDAELGLDVGPALRALQGALLRQDADLATWPGPPMTAAAAAPATPVDDRSPALDTARPAAAAPSTSTLTPLVGRAAELAVVDALLDQARTDGARWLTISGPAGMGKTRLADEAARSWAAAGGAVVRGQCPDLDDLPAWWPIRQILRELGADADAVLAPHVGGEVDTARFAVLEAATAIVGRRVAEQPLLIVVDDVHWADRASLTLLALLAETVTSAGLAVVLTTRHTRGRPEFDRLLDTLARRPDDRHLEVSQLAADDVAALVEHVSGERPSAADATGLHVRTGGTPFYVVEYARLPSDQRRGDRIPQTIRTVLRRRFGSLPAEVVEVLQVAAVLGDPLDVDVLAAVSRRAPDDVADLLDAAADAGVLTPATDAATYVFAHALLRDELAAGLPDLRRRRLHLRASEHLAVGGGLPTLLQRARHLQAAGPLADPATAFAAFREAARAADDQWLSETSALWWRAAVAAFDRHPDGDPRERDELVTAQVRAMAWAGQGQAVLDVLDAALVDALRAGHTASVGRLAANLLRVSGSWPWPVYGSDPAPLMATLHGLEAALAGDPAARSRVLAVTAIGHCYDPDPGVPDAMSRSAIELAEQTGNPDVLADALLGRALTYAGVASRSEESISILDRLAALGHSTAESDDVLRRNILTMALLNLGRYDECTREIRAAALGADVLRMPVNRVQLRWAEAAVAQWRGDLRRAAELYERAELAHRRTDLQQSGTFELASLVLMWDRGRLAEASGAVPTNPMVSVWTSAATDAVAGRPGGDEALAAEVRRPEPEVWTSHGRLALLAHCVADRALTGLAAPLLEAMAGVRECVAVFGQIGAVGPVALAMARLARLLGDHAAAQQHLDTAAEVARRSGGAGALVHCRLQAAEWAAADGATDGLREKLVAVAREADERGMSGLAERARALLG